MTLSETTRVVLVASLQSATWFIVGCENPLPGERDAGDADMEGVDAWDGGANDAEVDGDNDSHRDAGSGLSGRVEILTEENVGTVIIELAPAWEDGEPRRITIELGEDLHVPDLADGPYGLLAWLDEDGDDRWDGIWEGDGEPTARFGLTLPRHDLLVVLRRGVPNIVLDESPHFVELYDAAWRLAAGHIAEGTTANGFAHHYMDEAFSEQIFQWDTCFMTLFGRYGTDAFPVMESLDNFYGAQRDDGFICRVVNESDGEPCVPTESSEPMINPPIFGWSEHQYVLQTGDLSRLPRAVPVLEAYHGWLDENVRTDVGLYYTSMLGSGMDNAPRDDAYDGWVDITSQQAMGRRVLAELEELMGMDSSSASNIAEAERICDDIRALMWDDEEGFFFDLGWAGSFLTDKTLASIWPLLAGCADADQAERVVAHLRSPDEFWRLHVFASTSADAPSYDPSGFYWRGGVWPPTTYATIMAIDHVGHEELAREATENHLRALSRVFEEFVPDPAQLAPESRGDGRETLWELYAPDRFSPGTRWDRTFLGRQDFVGWTGIGPIALMLEQVIGLSADATTDRLSLSVTRTDRHGVQGYRFGDQLVDIVVRERSDVESVVIIDIETSDAFELDVGIGERRWSFDIERGGSTVEVDPSEASLPSSCVPAGPFPGYAVLGNGRISAVYSDDAIGRPTQGLTHLYHGGFGLDLIELAKTVVVSASEEITVGRIGLDPFFATFTERRLEGGSSVFWRTFVGESNAVVMEGALFSGDETAGVDLYPLIRLREAMQIDGDITLAEVGRERDILTATLSDGTGLALGMVPTPSSWQTGDIDARELVERGLSGEVDFGHDLALGVELIAGAGEQAPFRWVIAVDDGPEQALNMATGLLGAHDALEDAELHWSDWSPSTLCHVASDRCRVAASNLYAARASSLDGMVPADLTGQFVTNGFPQLYPRDALMVARAFHIAGHDDEAWEVVRDWLGSGRSRPSPGEWFARYDALGRAVDGGTGARYDVPEWDANGYLAVLVEKLGASELTSQERQELLEALDFLVAVQDDDGLFTEGGIVEWTGRLPSTAMTSWAGLDAGARLARRWGEPDRAASYLAAAGRIHGGLIELFDFDRALLADEREGRLDANASMLFGPVWGYPASPLVDVSLEWILGEFTGFGGGVRYFQGEGYGQDLFFFTTSAAAQYAMVTGQRDRADELLEWMMTMSNGYGLAPERVYQDGSGAADASPLSWCAAELATTILLLESAEAMPVLPVMDGIIDAVEYRRSGAVVVDTSGEHDDNGDPVALYSVREGEQLLLGLLISGDVGLSDSLYSLYLTDDSGIGSESLSEGGHRLLFRTNPGETPSSAARIVLDPRSGTCSMGLPPWSTGEELPCDAVAFGVNGFEASVDLEMVGLSGPTQIIVAASNDDREVLLPRHGALLSDGLDSSVLVTFEVDATPVVEELNPAAGVVITLSGDRPELGSWSGHAIALRDDGLGFDESAGDAIWTTVVRIEDPGAVEYKYLVGTVGDPTWTGVEFEGENRMNHVIDVDQGGRVWLRDQFGVRGTELVDP